MAVSLDERNFNNVTFKIQLKKGDSEVLEEWGKLVDSIITRIQQIYEGFQKLSHKLWRFSENSRDLAKRED